MRLFSLFLIFVLGVSLSTSATINWLGGTGTTWNTAANWDTGVIPTINDDVIIKLANLSSITVDRIPAFARNLTLISARLAVFSPITVDNVRSSERSTITIFENAPSSFRNVEIYSFDVFENATVNVWRSLRVEYDLFLFLGASLHLTGPEHIVGGTFFLSNSKINGTEYDHLRTQDTFITTDDVPANTSALFNINNKNNNYLTPIEKMENAIASKIINLQNRYSAKHKENSELLAKYSEISASSSAATAAAVIRPAVVSGLRITSRYLTIYPRINVTTDLQFLHGAYVNAGY